MELETAQYLENPNLFQYGYNWIDNQHRHHCQPVSLLSTVDTISKTPLHILKNDKAREREVTDRTLPGAGAGRSGPFPLGVPGKGPLA